VDSIYPDGLAGIYDPPPALFYRGNTDVIDATRLAIVGTRKGSELGKQFTQTLARDLADIGITIVSGLASGIDAAAHRGAINAKENATAAVLGTGVDIAYPKRNRELQQELERTGLLLSEYPPGTEPDGRHFPERNRIISGLSSAVVVVQAGVRSGAIITADFALEQGRDVYAVPGAVNDDLHKGCHRLIKEGAGLIESAEDVIDYLQVEGEFSPSDQTVVLEPEAHLLFEKIHSRPIHLNELAEETGLDHGTCSKHLLSLEDKGLILALPGQRYQRSQDAKQMTVEIDNGDEDDQQ
jgi:DNA processing protein